MAEPAYEGKVYKTYTGSGKLAHYWIVLNDPNAVDGRFVLVSLSDRHNFTNISDVWDVDYPLCDNFV